MIQLRGVSKTFPGHTALYPLTLTVPAGKVTVIIGPSGSGKSTLIRLILGLIDADTGEIRILGDPITAANRRELRLRIGYVVQDGGLFPHLTARENVTLVSRLLRRHPKTIVERLTELTRIVQLPVELLDRYPAQLSGGQRQRIGLIRALMLDPPVLLLDEPMAALDPLVRADLQTDLKAIFRELGKTVILVTHDLGEAAYLGDQLVLLNEGRIVQVGTLSELEQQPADPFVTRFLQAQRGYSGPSIG
jgi:osmoprotectant transport system ATP-binding protein